MLSGSSKKIDEAIEKNEKLESFLIQDINETYDQDKYWSKLKEIVYRSEKIQVQIRGCIKA